MAITINLESTIIPVSFNTDKGTIDFNVNMDDESMLVMQEKLRGLKAIAKEMRDKASFENNKSVVKDTYDSILGEGAFDEIYAYTPSLITLAGTMVTIANGLIKEFEKRTNTGKNHVQSYKRHR